MRLQTSNFGRFITLSKLLGKGYRSLDLFLFLEVKRVGRGHLHFQHNSFTTILIVLRIYRFPDEEQLFGEVTMDFEKPRF